MLMDSDSMPPPQHSIKIAVELPELVAWMEACLLHRVNRRLHGDRWERRAVPENSSKNAVVAAGGKEVA